MAEHEMRVDDGGGRERIRRVDLPSNSLKNKKEPVEKPQQEKIVTGPVVQRKKGLAGKFGGNFLAESGEGVLQYVLMEVLLPAAKSTISDVVSMGVERLLYGDQKSRPRSDRPGGYTNYSKIAKQAAGYGQHVISQRGRALHEFDDIVLATRGEAEEVLDRLREIVDVYNVASVADLYDACGITTDFTDNKFGWDDLRSASVRLTRGGYLLSLPRPQPLD